MTITYRSAENSDISQVLELHHRYQVNSISEDDKNDGFITTAFSQKQLAELIERENGLSVAIKENKVVAYAMAASWGYWSQWPMFAHMVEGLAELQYAEQTLSIDNSYQYGPVCVDKSLRGEGVFEKIFDYSLKSMADRYPILITFINKTNSRSYNAHTRKAGLDVIHEFEYNNKQYYELACLSSKAPIQ